ncbi:MAG: translesion error-prone DNA polymerase V autoproteolytic subunit [Rudaea sp.]|nr:translesion error-prone DNA polymerase V autoproteolytic subunit [Rudaea sp.]
MKSQGHGGAREGAGRKSGSGPYREPTHPVRVPESQTPAVIEFLAAYRDRRTLEDEGVRATMPRGVQRSRRLRSIPLSGFRVAAGFGSPAEDYIEERIDFNAHLIRQGHDASTFVVRAQGWSMIGAGIHDGDEIVVDRALEPKDMSVVVATVNGELVIKRLKMRAGKIALVSDNPHYPERVLAEGETLEIWGVATRVLHPL